VGLGDLLGVDQDGLAGRGVGAEAEHQAARHRPGLAADVAHVGHLDLGFLGHLADHRLLGRLAGVDEPGQDRHPAARPGGVPGQQAAVVRVGHQHDHRGVGAREVLGAVGRAAGGVPARIDHRRGPVDRAVRVRVVPVGQGHRVREQARVAVAEQRPDLAQRQHAGPGRGDGQVGRDAEVDDPVGVLAEQEPGAGGRPGGRHEDQRGIVLVHPDQDAAVRDHEHAGARVGPGRVQPGHVGPLLGDPVHRAPGQGQ
jgi:hypothetical protein